MADKPTPKRLQSDSPEEKKTSPSPAQEGGGEKPAGEKAPAYVPPATREKRQRSVVHYIAILFAAAFVLMLLTYLMDRRQNEVVVDNLNQSLSDLQESLSDRSSLQDIYEDNLTLIDQVDQLEDQVQQLQQEKKDLSAQLSSQQKTAQAMDWFWQIDEAYVLGRYSLCRELIGELEDAGLVSSLPQESITDNGRFSPAGRYQEIYEALY